MLLKALADTMPLRGTSKDENDWMEVLFPYKGGEFYLGTFWGYAPAIDIDARLEREPNRRTATPRLLAAPVLAESRR